MTAGEKKVVKLQIIGGGAAGLSFFIAADRYRYIRPLLSEGVVIIDANKKDYYGVGALPNYDINSNSAATDFVENVSKDGVFAELFRTKSSFLNYLRGKGEDPVPLPQVANYLKEMGEVIRREVDQSEASTFVEQTKVARIEKHGTLDSPLWSSYDTEGSLVATSRNLLIACGGMQCVKTDVRGLCQGNQTLCIDHLKEQVVLSGSVLTETSSKSVLDKHLASGKPIVILGGSHSSFSVAWRLVTTAEKYNMTLGEGSILMLHKNTIRIYYRTEEEAVKDGFVYDKTMDVCPMNGAVHRFGGIREDAKRLYQRISHGIEKRVTLVFAPALCRAQISDIMEAASTIVQAYGYEAAHLPIINRETGEEIHFKKRKDGQVLVSDSGILFDSEGKELKGLYAAGLGFGLMPTKEAGGEQIFRMEQKPIDGMNMYMGVVGDVIMRKFQASA